MLFTDVIFSTPDNSSPVAPITEVSHSQHNEFETIMHFNSCPHEDLDTIRSPGVTNNRENAVGIFRMFYLADLSLC